MPANIELFTVYSTNCVKQPLKNTKILMTIGSLMKVESIIAFCNTFDLH